MSSPKCNSRDWNSPEFLYKSGTSALDAQTDTTTSIGDAGIGGGGAGVSRSTSVCQRYGEFYIVQKWYVMNLICRSLTLICLSLVSTYALSEVHMCENEGRRVFSSIPCDQEKIDAMVDKRIKDAERERVKRLERARRSKEQAEMQAKRREELEAMGYRKGSVRSSSACDRDYQIAMRKYDSLQRQGRATAEHAAIVMGLAAEADSRCGY